jgi:hypothetical protein
MPTEKAAIAEVLQSLDHTKDDLWTDDGSPLVSEIQRLANDKTITRAQINDALPGFARKSSESIEEPADDGKDEFGDPVVVAAVEAVAVAKPQSSFEAAVELSPEADYERLRLIARGRVEDAEVAVAAAKVTISEAYQSLAAAEGRLTRALQLYSARYPAISAAANIKQHLASQQEALYERVTGNKAPPRAGSAMNPIDATMMDRKRDNGRNRQAVR